ncbi:MAG: peptidyl-prolyl cis-trans isomerase [Candidatus Parcubacteria bacterium]|jgi:peptidylprolyl isomerase
MSDYKQIIIAFLVTIVVISGLATFVAWQNGELSRLTAVETYEDVEVPFALKNADKVPTDTKKEPEVPNAQNTNPNEASMNQATPNPVITMSTSQGDISIELFMDTMPVTAGNFLKLVKEGFYNGTKFHRVIDGFMVQGGDPNTKSEDASRYGQGGPGYAIKDEFAPGLSNVRGTLSMANSGPNTGGSQFFINLVPNTYLDGKHPVFGRVVSDMSIVDKISLVPRNERDVPLEPVVLTKVAVKE